MSTTPMLIAAIVCFLGILLSYAFVKHTIKQRQEQQQRLVNALRARSNQLESLLDGLPPGYLPRDLRILLLDRQLDVLVQLVKLEPGNTGLQQTLQQMQASKVEKYTQRRISLTQAKQIRLAKESLGELHKMIVRLREKNAVDDIQYTHYRQQIKGLLTQIGIDSYCVSASHARQSGKLKLALQTYESALALIDRECSPNELSGLRKEISSLIEALETTLVELQQVPVDSSDEADHRQKTVNAERAYWKKNSVYD